MQKVAKASSFATIFVVIATSSFSKVGDWTELELQDASIVISSIHDLQCIGCNLFVFKLHVDMSNHVIAVIVHHVQLQHSTQLGELEKEIFIKVEIIF